MNETSTTLNGYSGSGTVSSGNNYLLASGTGINSNSLTFSPSLTVQNMGPQQVKVEYLQSQEM